MMRVLVMRMVMPMMVVTARERGHGNHNRHKQNERQQLFHVRDYSHPNAGRNTVTTRTNQRRY